MTHGDCRSYCAACEQEEAEARKASYPKQPQTENEVRLALDLLASRLRVADLERRLSEAQRAAQNARERAVDAVLALVKQYDGKTYAARLPMRSMRVDLSELMDDIRALKGQP